MRKVRVFRDPVHVSIEFDRNFPPEALVLDLLDTPEVQRLRHVRQLGLANTVYHGAEHSRFSHTLGVVHLAKRMYRAGLGVESLPTDVREYGVVLAAAVLHDVGHAPFSHAMEKVTGVDHEDLSAHVLTSQSTRVHEVLAAYGEEHGGGGDAFTAEVVAHISGNSDARTAQIISSQLDADRMDYVMRDGYFAGVPNAQFDLERILLKTRLDDEHGLYFDLGAQQAIEGYFIARYHLYLQLYYHRTVRTAESLLRAIMERAKIIAEEGGNLGPVGRLHEVFRGDAAPEVMLDLTDHELWAAFRMWATSAEDETLRDLSNRLITRRLLKVTEIKPDVPPAQMVHINKQLNSLIANAGLDPAFYLHYDTAADTPYKITDVVASASKIRATKVSVPGSGVRSLENVSKVIESLQHNAYSKSRVCYPESVRDSARQILKSVT